MVTRLSLRPLRRKMLRELWRLRGQLVSIGLVVATAVTTLVAMRGTYEALELGRAEYYRDYRLAHVWAELERAPLTLTRDIAAIPGVTAAEPRVSTFATLDLPWLATPGMGLFLSIPATRSAQADAIHVREGRTVRAGQANEVVVSENFFLANDLSVGDTLRAVINGVRRDLRIVGSAIAPDQSYAAPPGGLYPEGRPLRGLLDEPGGARRGNGRRRRVQPRRAAVGSGRERAGGDRGVG